MRESVKLWLEALRSGEHKQSKGQLHSVSEHGVEAYCCLGVACQVAETQGVDVPRSPKGRIRGAYLGFIQQDTREWLGLKSEYGDFLIDSKVTSLITFNDELGKTFSEIADVIEDNYDSLFHEE